MAVFLILMLAVILAFGGQLAVMGIVDSRKRKRSK